MPDVVPPSIRPFRFSSARSGGLGLSVPSVSARSSCRCTTSAAAAIAFVRPSRRWRRRLSDTGEYSDSPPMGCVLLEMPSRSPPLTVDSRRGLIRVRSAVTTGLGIANTADRPSAIVPVRPVTPLAIHGRVDSALFSSLYVRPLAASATRRTFRRFELTIRRPTWVDQVGQHLCRVGS